MIGIPVITQSDPGTENYGVANAHTVMRHRLDPSLKNSLQHRFAKGHNNILSEIKWSVFRRDFSPGFEDMLELGVQNGWYDINDTLENLLFRWIAIPWLQTELDNWVKFKNTTAPRAVKNKILPRGVPALIRSRPSHFNAADFKIPVPPTLLDEVEALYAPKDHPVFELVPQTFHELADNLYSAIGQPEITHETFWDIYRELLRQLRNGQDEELAGIISSHRELESTQPDEEMDLLPNMEPFRLGQPLNIGNNVSYIGGLDGDPRPEYAIFTSDEEEDDSDIDI